GSRRRASGGPGPGGGGPPPFRCSTVMGRRRGARRCHRGAPTPNHTCTGDDEMKRILVAYDGTDPSRRALDAAIELTTQFGGTLAVVSVIPVRPGRAPVDPWDDKPVHDQQLAEARDYLAAHGVHAEILEPAGDPAEAIERVAERGGF